MLEQTRPKRAVRGAESLKRESMRDSLAVALNDESERKMVLRHGT
jgi:hypothetical protein